MSLITITYVNFFLPVCIYASWGTYKKKKKDKARIPPLLIVYSFTLLGEVF